MSDKLSIKLNIANRIYPMKIDRKSEEFIRNAVKKIENRLKFYEQNYAIKDKQDLLAMCLIEYASKSESENNYPSSSCSGRQFLPGYILSCFPDSFFKKR